MSTLLRGVPFMLAGERILEMGLSGSKPLIESLGRGEMDLVNEPAESYLEASETEVAVWGNLKLEDIGSEAFLWEFELVGPADPPECGFTDDVTLGMNSCSANDEEALSKGEGTEAKWPFAGADWY